MKKLITLTLLAACLATFSNAAPPEVNNFRVACSNDRFTITWTTQFENNNRRFLIYKSDNGMKFDLAAIVPTLAPAGNSDISLSYAYTDNGILASGVYYKLASEDRNGRVTDWGVTTPSCGLMGNSIALMPNPATTQSVLTLNGVRELLNIRVNNSLGQNIYQNRAANTVYLPTGKWGSDVYVVTVTNRRNEVVYQNKLVVQ